MREGIRGTRASSDTGCRMDAESRFDTHIQYTQYSTILSIDAARRFHTGPACPAEADCICAGVASGLNSTILLCSTVGQSVTTE